MVIVLPNRDCLVCYWFYCRNYIMKIKEIEKERKRKEDLEYLLGRKKYGRDNTE